MVPDLVAEVRSPGPLRPAHPHFVEVGLVAQRRGRHQRDLDLALARDGGVDAPLSTEQRAVPLGAVSEVVVEDGWDAAVEVVVVDRERKVVVRGLAH